ncbi:hypothetical protein MHU86_8397 [Fragilaria crotonensis]|nr:hypothetical protein MHU86_8397 [Fragilaria crotonensis]
MPLESQHRPGEGPPATRGGEEAKYGALCIARRRTFTPRLLSGRDARRGGRRFAAASLQPCFQMEAIVLRSVWLRTIAPRDRPGSLREPLPPRRSQPDAPNPLPDMGLRSGPRPLSHVTDVPPRPCPRSRCRTTPPHGARPGF